MEWLMETTHLLCPDQGAEQTFGPARLGDQRRTRRAVKAACGMVRDPAAARPKQHPTWKDLKAVYRLLDEPDVTFEALMQPHWQQTRACLPHEAVVLLVQDTREIDLSAHATMTGLGPIGNGQGRGFLLQTVLAVAPEAQRVLGCLAQRPFLRVPAPPQEQRYHRRHREHRETDVWMQMVEQIGTPVGAGLLVHGGDRGADMLPFFRQGLATQTHFVGRAAQNRRIQAGEQAIALLLDQVRSWPSQGQRPFAVPASHGREKRQTTLQISVGPAPLLPPWNDPRGNKEPLPVWVVRVWESEPSVEEEALEWILLTSLCIETCAHAWQRVDWYRCRWVVEEYHQCLKTGCRLEERSLRTIERLLRLLGVLSPIAVRLLQLRDLARLAPEGPAAQVMEAEACALIAARASLPPAQLTLARFWQEVARLGGHLGRRRDGPPGWKTLWKGWLHLQTMLEGVHLAAPLRL
jgi:hypothetical protein